MSRSTSHGRIFKVGLALCAVGVLTVTVGVTPAAASDDLEVAEEIATLISEVSPFQGNVTRTSQVHQSFAAQAGTLPSSASAPIVVGGADIPLVVSLPREVATTAGVEASDGTVVYPSVDNEVEIAAQVLDTDKVRVQTIIDAPTDTHEFTYELGNGYTPAEAADGSFWAYNFDAEGEMDIYGVGEAWARDADGAVVDTHYEIRGDALVQIVTPNADVVYPIVADPTWEWYNAAYGAGFSKAETRNLTNLGGIAGLCGALWKWPALGAACAIAGAQWWTQAGLAVNAKGCVFIAAVPAPLAVRWISSKCK